MLRQSLEIVRLNLLVLPQRWGTSAISVVSIACVVAVFVGLFSIATSFQSILQSDADTDTLLIMSEGADFEGGSSLDRSAVNVIGNSSFIRRDEAGAMASFEMTRPISANRKVSGDPVNINVRGITAAAYGVRSGFSLVDGRLIDSGRFELMAGRAARDQFAELDVGDTVTIADTRWEIVGVFENDGGATESELWADLRSLQSAFHIGDTVQSGRAKLADPDSLAAFRDELVADPRVAVSIRPESDFYAESSNGFLAIVRLLSTPLVVIMALGAIFAALNTMYSSVSARTREIATLRAIGFRFSPIAISVFTESLLLALTGAALGIIVIYFGLNGYSTNSNFLSNTQYAFSFVITPQLMGRGVFWALVMGFLGGLLPAIRARRMSIVAALREL